MPRTCTLCRHPHRHAIDEALVKGEALRTIAQQFATSAWAVMRHKAHVPATLVKAHQAREVARADTLVSRIEALVSSVERVLKRAEAEGTHRGDLRVLAAVREHRETLELLAKMAGELRDGTTVNVLVSSEWSAVRALIMDALGPFPDARVAVVKALRRTNGGG